MAKAVKAALTRPVTVRPRKVDHDAAPTVRRLVSVPPVREEARRVDERSGERPIAKRGRDERKPDSGVRPSVRAATAQPQTFDALRSGTRARVPQAPEAERATRLREEHDSSGRPLTYSFYTVAQLHLQPRAAMPMPSPTRIVRFEDVLRATRDLVRVVDQYQRTPAPRLPFMQVTAVARAAWVAEAKGFAAQWPLGKIALGVGAFFVSVLVLLIAAIAIAELTDDIPRSHRTTSTVAVAQPKQPPPVVEAAPAPPAPIAEAPREATIEIDELDDVSKPAPAKAKKSGGTKSKKPFDRFMP